MVAVIAMNYFAYLQFFSMSTLSLLAGLVMILIQAAALIVIACLVYLGMDAMKVYLAKNGADSSCCKGYNGEEKE